MTWDTIVATMASRNDRTLALNAQADQLARTGRLADAGRLYRQACERDPVDVEAWLKLSAVQRRLGALDAAEQCARTAVRLQPALARAHFALAAALHAGGRREEAITAYRSAIDLAPDIAMTHYVLGTALHESDRVGDALASYRRAIELQPGFVEAESNLAAALIALGRVDEAESVLQQALARRPGAPALLLNLASVAERRTRFDVAVDLYGQALRALPADSAAPLALDARAALATLLEKLGRVDEAAEQVERGLALGPAHPRLGLAAALVARRQGRIDEAIGYLESIDRQPLPHLLAGQVGTLLGQLLDQRGDSARALPAVVEGKRRLALAAPTHEAERQRYAARLHQRRSEFDRLDRAAAPSPADAAGDDDAPAFLVGFPRSGTTLLEQILDAHPALQTMEERPALAAAERALEAAAGASAIPADGLTGEQVRSLRRVYFDEVRRHLEREPGTRLVDKLPLNIVRVPLAHRLFPRARFILALRHPCDVCLSCLMQDFSVNEAMASFFTLEDTARLYADVMGLWMEYARALPLPVHAVRYEDLVADVPGEARRLLDFLGVGWHDAVLGHTEHARRRGVIFTPSYHQVTQAVYRRAAWRWKRYADSMAPVLPVLQPFVDAFGYAE